MVKKTLGQIAHETGERVGRWQRRWFDMSQRQQGEWEDIAPAIAASVKEEDAKLCESRHENGNYKYDTRHDCAEAIRASIKQEVTE